MEATENTNQLYELSFHLLSTVEEGAVAIELDKIRAVVSQYSGAIVKEQQPEKFNLAYTIVRKLGGKNEKYDSSYFGYLLFEATPEGAHSINTDIKGINNVLRYLLIGISREALSPHKRRSAPVATKPAGKTKVDPDAPKMTKADMDSEIEKLVVK